MKEQCFLKTIIFLFSLICCTAFGAENLDDKVITIGVYDDPPAVYKKDDKIDGYFPKILETIFIKNRIKYKYEYGTWDEIYNGVENGKIDMIYDIAKTAEREKIFDFNNETFIMSWGCLYSRKNIKVYSLMDLASKRIAIVKNDIYYEGQPDSLKELLNSFGITSKFVETGGFGEAIKAVENNKADICILNREFADYKLKNTKLKQLPIIFKPVQIHIAFTKDSKVGKILIPIIDSEIRKMKSDPKSKFYEIINSYFVSYTVVKEIPEWVWLPGGGILIVSFLILVLFHNISLRREVKIKTGALEEANTRLKDLSIHDPLTKIDNRRSFAEKLQYEITRAHRYNSRLSLIMFDIDHFKTINDTFGHIIGDKVLIKVANIIKTSVRSVDTVARYGGEEFTVILMETSIEDGETIANKIKSRIENESYDDLLSDKKVTITGGIVEWKENFTTIEMLINAADSAMYEGKLSGRNKIVKYCPK